MPYNYNVASDPNLLSIPRACVDVAILGADDKPATGWRNLGNVSAASVQFAFEEAEHFTSCGEQRVRDARVPVQVTADFSMQLDALLDLDNLQLIFSGDTDTRIGSSLTPSSVLEYTADNPTQVGVGSGVLAIPNPYYTGTDGLADNQSWGRSYQLWRGEIAGTDYIFGGPASGQTFDNGTSVVTIPAWFPTLDYRRLENAAQVTVFDVLAVSPGSPTPAEVLAAEISAVQLTGYVVDPMYGTVSFDFASGTLFSKLSTYGAANPTYKYIKFPISLADRSGTGDASIPHINRMRALTRTSRPIALRFRQQDTNRPGFRAITIIHKVRLIPNGNFDMISDGTEFSTAPLEGSLELPAWADSTVRGREGWYTREDVKADAASA